MRAVVQRVSEASLHIEGNLYSEIGAGMLVLLGIEENDTAEDVAWLCSKIARLRIFPDEHGVMNIDVKEASGEILLASQFTLHASTRKGNRPSYIKAARPEQAIPLYEMFIQQLTTESDIPVKTGKFGAMMDIRLLNCGPVTIIIDSREKW